MRVAVAKAAPPPQLDEAQARAEDGQLDSLQAAADPTVASEQHCRFCFDALAAQLCGRPLPASAAAQAFGEANCALFVTWNKRQPRHHHNHSSTTGSNNKRSSSATTTYHLRGCIGTLEPRPLRAALKDYALTSALRDRRFDPIRADEVPLLKVTVSLLRRFERASHPEDWEVGTHGIILTFADPSLPAAGGGGGGQTMRRSATFLPEVAGEQGWTRRQTVEAAVRKAGYSGPVTRELLASAEVTRYQSTRWELTYGQWRRWAKDGGGVNGGGGGEAALVAAVERSASASASASGNHHHHGSGALLWALRRLLRGGGSAAEEEEQARHHDEWEEEEEDEEEEE